MLTEKEKKEIEKELRHYDYKQAACIEALKIVQRHRGWISDDSILDIAEFLEMTPDELDGVATFYNLIFRRQVGKHVIFICDSISCWVMRYEDILDYLQERLGIGPGETTADGKFTILPVACLGACDGAPAIMMDETLYTNVNRALLDDMLCMCDRRQT